MVLRRNYTTALRGAPGAGGGHYVLHAAHLMCVIAAAVISRNVANQELLDTAGPGVLGESYIAVSLVTGFVLAVLGWLARNLDTRVVARICHTMVVLVLFGAFFRSSYFEGSVAWVVVKYITLEIAAAAALLVFGLMLGARLGPRDARRNASSIGVGGIIGGLLGGFALKVGAPLLGSHSLYLIAAVFAVAPIFFLPATHNSTNHRPRHSTVLPDRSEVGALAVYGRWVSITTLLMVCTTTVIDFQYRAVASSAFASDRMTAFFGDVTLLTGLATLLLQMTLVDRLLKHVGLFATATVMPAALVLCSAVFGMFPGLLSLVLLKLVDSGTNMSVQQATGGLLLAPLSSRARAVWQSRIDGLAKRGGQAIAGVYLAAFAWTPTRLVPVVLLLCAMWLVCVLITRLSYVHLLTDMLGAPTSDEPELEAVDGETLRLLLRELPLAPPARVAVILDLLEDAGFEAPRDMLLTIVERDPSGGAAMRIVQHFSLLGDVSSLRSFSENPNPEIAGAALLALVHVAPDSAASRSRQILAQPRTSPDTLKALAAGVLGERDDAAFQLCREFASSDEAATRAAAARALGQASASGSVDVAAVLCELALDEDGEVAKTALQALSSHPNSPSIETLLKAVRRRDVRGTAMRALADLGIIAGAGVAKELHQSLNDPPYARSLTWVLGRMASRNGIVALVGALDSRHVSVRLSAAVAMTSITQRHPELEFPHGEIEPHYLREIEFFARMKTASELSLPRSPAGQLLRRALKQTSKMSLEVLFRLLALRYPEESIHAAFAGIASRDARQRQIALELLHTILEPRTRAALAEAVSAQGKAHQSEKNELRRQLTDIATDKDRFLSGLARAVLVELRLAPEKALGDAMTQSLVNQVLELQALSLFSHSSAEDLAEVASLVAATTLPPETELFREGEDADACYLIRAGAVAVSRSDVDIDRLGPGDACGIIAVLDQLPRETTARTVSECSVFVIKADDLIQLLADRPLLMHSMFRALTHAIRAQVDRVSLEKRLR